MKVGLFFGSFNPIHVGHLIIANIAYESMGLDEVWFVVSPQNPLKKNKNLLHEFDRYDLVQAAVADDFRFRASDIEFNLPKPSYTIDTLTVLSEEYKQHDFSLIIGSDNLVALPKWKNYQKILEHFKLIVYPRPNAKDSELLTHDRVDMIDAPEIDISATLIRKMLREGQSIKYLVPELVLERILAKGLFTE
ncbi:nicotinate (nicotinamide) nucleotide adenylyltransferase [Marinoscillum sp. MHG1-6]|uniref:nicotinate (nicotinamide) nucleotide adenylyltransferase n=1 Tax=Marinoscillum sp. MHG1-6 TaxID=2959627 RepID=UPI0021588F41|nr:nicotinate (nicotinamide) nucleotide adenylyltransferase [Marinoscillum sp. MHG1-6]